MTDDRAAHWDGVFTTKAADEVSWHQAEPATSLRLLAAAAPPPAAVVDVGAGAGVLPDRLLATGWTDVTVLDVSGAAVAAVRDRLGERIAYVVTDLLAWAPPRGYDAWHDRAVFHFLVDTADRARYVDVAARAVRPGGVAVVATFAADGPTSCSGLPTARYDADALAAVFAPRFVAEASAREEHGTPFGTVQPFTWVVLRRVADGG